MEPKLFRLAAFAEREGGGNPAGVWIGDTLPSAEQMQAIAAEVGYSETAFVAPASGLQRDVRYYSPRAEVSFCGHATIASGVALGQLSGAGDYRLQTAVGEVGLQVGREGESWTAALRSVPPQQRELPDGLLQAALAALRWRAEQLDPALPSALIYAGAWHLLLAVRESATLDALDYDFKALQSLCDQHGLTTLQLIWREHSTRFHSRNPFPAGGVYEDPATGASAAAFAGYLRERGLIQAPVDFEIVQGVAMGRPSRLQIHLPVSGGIIVRGGALSL